MGQLRNELADISNRIEQTRTSHGTFEISVRRGRDEDATSLREDASQKIATLAAYSEKQFKRTREVSEKRLVDEIKELEMQNEETINGVIEKNGSEIQIMRMSYNVTMNENLDMITSLRKEVLLLQEQDRHDRRVLTELRNQNNGIVVPLKTNHQDLDRLEPDLDFSQNKRRI